MTRDRLMHAGGILAVAVAGSTAMAWDAAETEILRLERIDVLRIVYSPSLQRATVTTIRGACPPETVTHTDSDFGPGQYVVQAGFAQDEAAGAAWVLPADRWPIKFDQAEILFATANATQSTTTHWGSGSRAFSDTGASAMWWAVWSSRRTYRS